MDFEQIRYELDDHVLTITLNRPDALNAWTPRMGAELEHAFDLADADDDVRAIVMTGAGRAYCAGADLSGGGATFDWRERASGGGGSGAGGDGEGDWESEGGHSAPGDTSLPPRDGGGRFALRIFNCNKPVIAAINGSAVGVGITMTLPMDVRIVSEDAKLGFVFARRGIVPEACSSWFLPRVVGISRAMEWVASGRIFTAAEALEAGLVREACAKDEVLPTATAIAREIADSAAPVSVALARRLMWTMLGAAHPMEAHRADSRAMFARGQSADAIEGVTSFLEKRPARFTDSVSAGLPDIFPGRVEPEFE